jgi:hypothetical protein
MIIHKKNEGTYIKYKLDGIILSLQRGELTLDLSDYEQDYPIHLDISEDGNRKLVIGSARWYLAEIDIPAREYKIEAGEKDDAGFPRLKKTAQPLNTAKVALTLWAVEA